MKENEQSLSEHVVPPDLFEVSRKTGLVIRSPDSAAVNSLFAELEKYEAQNEPKPSIS